MKKYEVMINCTIRKTLVVEAENEQEAEERAHEQFTTECDGDEYYNQETIGDVIEVME